MVILCFTANEDVGVYSLPNLVSIQIALLGNSHSCSDQLYIRTSFTS